MEISEHQEPVALYEVDLLSEIGVDVASVAVIAHSEGEAAVLAYAKENRGAYALPRFVGRVYPVA